MIATRFFLDTATARFFSTLSAGGHTAFAITLPPGAPATIVDSVTLGDYAEALDLSPDGRTVAVVCNSGQEPAAPGALR